MPSKLKVGLFFIKLSDKADACSCEQGAALFETGRQAGPFTAKSIRTKTTLTVIKLPRTRMIAVFKNLLFIMLVPDIQL